MREEPTQETDGEQSSMKETTRSYGNLLHGTDLLTALPTILYAQEDVTPTSERYIPVLDDPIDPTEISRCIRKLKSDKAPGIDGIAPRVLKLLSEDGILVLIFIFNEVFAAPTLNAGIRRE